MNISSLTVLLAVSMAIFFLLMVVVLIIVLRLTDTIKKVDFSKLRQEEENVYEEEIRNIANEGHEQGAILADEAKMISNIFEFGDMEYPFLK